MERVDEECPNEGKVVWWGNEGRAGGEWWKRSARGEQIIKKS
jgi:hypothetical protein